MKKAKGTTAMGEAGFLEAMVNGEFMAIVDKGKGLAKYNKDYNKK